MQAEFSGLEGRPSQHRICGLRKVTFWLTLALVTTIILGIVGGSVGGTLSHKSQTEAGERESSASSASAANDSVTNSLSSTTSSTSSAVTSHYTTSDSVTTSLVSTASSTSSAVTSGSTGFSAMDCVDARTLASEKGTIYREYCAEDWPGGSDGVQDISKTTEYTFQACIDACDTYNAQRDIIRDLECRAVTYDSNLTSSIAAYNANCYLKNAQGPGLASLSEASAARAH